MAYILESTAPNQVSSINFSDQYQEHEITPFYWEQREYGIGTPSVERSNHSAIITEDFKLVIFGGHDALGNELSEFIMYEIKTNNWVNPVVNRYYEHKGRKLQVMASMTKLFQLQPYQELSSSPPPRAFHTAVCFNNQMFVYGGNLHECNGEVYILDMQYLCWTVVSLPNNPPEVKTARSHHTANVWNQKMIVFGGLNGQTPLNSLVTFDLIKFKWTTLNTSLPPVSSHSSFIRNYILFIVGGYTAHNYNSFLAINLLDGSAVRAADYIPPDFVIHRRLLTTAFDPLLDRLYIFGGYEINSDDTEGGCVSQMTIIDFSTRKMGVIPDVMKPYPTPQCGHSVNLFEGKLLLFGGCDRLPLLNGDWVYCDFSNTPWIFHPPPKEIDLEHLKDFIEPSD